MSGGPTLLDLPTDVQALVAHCLTPLEVCSLARTSAELSASLRDDLSVWRVLANRELPTAVERATAAAAVAAGSSSWREKCCTAPSGSAHTRSPQRGVAGAGETTAFNAASAARLDASSASSEAMRASSAARITNTSARVSHRATTKKIR